MNIVHKMECSRCGMKGFKTPKAYLNHRMHHCSYWKNKKAKQPKKAKQAKLSTKSTSASTKSTSQGKEGTLDVRQFLIEIDENKEKTFKPNTPEQKKPMRGRPKSKSEKHSTNKCHLCDREYKSSGALNFHKRLAHKAGEPVICSNCGRTGFTSQTVYLKHVQTCTGEPYEEVKKREEQQKPYGCKLCHRRYGEMHPLNFHMRVTHKIGPPVKCLKCKKSGFRSRALYYKHMRTCDEAVQEQEPVEKHVQAGSEESEEETGAQESNRFQCKHCKEVFKSRSSLQFHMKMAHKKKGRPIECLACGKRDFTSRQLYFRHVKTCMKQMNDEEDGAQAAAKYQCKYCNQHYKQEVMLNFHLSAIHNACPPVECDKCGKNDFRSPAIYNKHKKTCTGDYSEGEEDRGQLLECSHCGENDFTSSADYYLHRRTCYGELIEAAEQLPAQNVDKVICRFCDQVFRIRAALNFHLRSVHKHGDPVECKTCGKNDFQAQSSFSKHVRKCGNEQTEEVDVIDQDGSPTGEASLGDHDYHVKEKTPGSKQACDLCGEEEFSDEEAFLRHKRECQQKKRSPVAQIEDTAQDVSSNPEPLTDCDSDFQCPKCHISYRNAPSYDFHLRTAHNIGRPVKCSWCGKEGFRSYTAHKEHSRDCRAQALKEGRDKIIDSLHSRDFVPRFMCRFCDVVYKQRDSLDFHLRAIHKTGPPVECKRCGQNDFISLATYSRHIRQCKGELTEMVQAKFGADYLKSKEKPEKFICPYCKHLYSTRGALGDHIRVYHNVGEQVKCAYCDREDFLSQASYTRHVRDCEQAHQEAEKNEPSEGETKKASPQDKPKSDSK